MRPASLTTSSPTPISMTCSRAWSTDSRSTVSALPAGVLLWRLEKDLQHATVHCAEAPAGRMLLSRGAGASLFWNGPPCDMLASKAQRGMENGMIKYLFDAMAPPQTAKSNRDRVAAAERGAVMEEAAKKANAVRANMARLRELRLTKEADTIREQIAAGNTPSAKAKKRSR